MEYSYYGMYIYKEVQILDKVFVNGLMYGKEYYY